MHSRDTILHFQQGFTIKKAHVKFQPDWLKIFREEVKNVKKRTIHASLYLIMHTTDTIFIDYLI